MDEEQKVRKMKESIANQDNSVISIYNAGNWDSYSEALMHGATYAVPVSGTTESNLMYMIAIGDAMAKAIGYQDDFLMVIQSDKGVAPLTVDTVEHGYDYDASLEDAESESTSNSLR